jgi:hypothetical protein
VYILPQYLHCQQRDPKLMYVVALLHERTSEKERSSLKDPLCSWCGGYSCSAYVPPSQITEDGEQIVSLAFGGTTDVERMFSVCGLICTSNRASLSPDHINVLTSLNLWLKEKYGYRNMHADKSADSCKSELCNHLYPSRVDSTIWSWGPGIWWRVWRCVAISYFIILSYLHFGQVWLI